MADQLPLPERRQHLRVTEHGGWMFRCDCGGSGQAFTLPTEQKFCEYRPNGMDAPVCGKPVTYVEANPRVRSGWVVKIDQSITGDDLVYLGAAERSRMSGQAMCVLWRRVLDVEVLG